MSNATRDQIQTNLILIIQTKNAKTLEVALELYDSLIEPAMLLELLPRLSKVSQRNHRRVIKMKILDLIHKTVLGPIMASL